MVFLLWSFLRFYIDCDFLGINVLLSHTFFMELFEKLVDAELIFVGSVYLSYVPVFIIFNKIFRFTFKKQNLRQNRNFKTRGGLFFGNQIRNKPSKWFILKNIFINFRNILQFFVFTFEVLKNISFLNK